MYDTFNSVSSERGFDCEAEKYNISFLNINYAIIVKNVCFVRQFVGLYLNVCCEVVCELTDY